MATVGKKRKIFDNRYEIVEMLGRGGKSLIYHARYEGREGEDVALKVLLNVRDLIPARTRLRIEAQAILACQHPYVVRLYDFQSYDDLSYLALEYAPHKDLRKYSEGTGGSLDSSKAELFFRQALEALHFIHSVGYIHRDIKPDNILVISEDEIRLSDFGVAAPIDSPEAREDLRKAIGTMSYLAPELLEGRGSGPSADLYSLALTFYELLSGSHPFENQSIADGFNARRTPLPRINQKLPWISPDFADVLMNLLEPDQEDRIQSAKEALSKLAGHSESASMQVQEHPAPTEKTASPVERYPLKQKDREEDSPTERTEEFYYEESAISQRPTTAVSASTVESVRGAFLAGTGAQKSDPEFESEKIRTHGDDAGQPKEAVLTLILEKLSSLVSMVPRPHISRRALIFVSVVGLFVLAGLGLGLFDKKTLRTLTGKAAPSSTGTVVETSPLPKSSGEAVRFPALPKGVYTGEISGLLPAREIPVTFISTEHEVSVILGMAGWTPSVIETASASDLRATSSGWILRFTKENSKESGEADQLAGEVTNLVTGDKGKWKILSIR